jgi:hypothetical protein
MKKLLFFLCLLGGFTTAAQVPISQLPTYNGNPNGGLVPIVIGGTTRKVDASLFGFNKIDSVVIRNDSLFYYRRGLPIYGGRIIGGSGMVGTLHQVLLNGNTSSLGMTVDYLNTPGGGAMGSDGTISTTESFYLKRGIFGGFLQSGSLSASRFWNFPNRSGNVAFSVNGVLADSLGNITIPGGTAGTLDQVLANGSTAPTRDITVSGLNGELLRLIGLPQDLNTQLPGLVYFNSTTGKFRFREGGTWVSHVSQTELNAKLSIVDTTAAFSPFVVGHGWGLQRLGRFLRLDTTLTDQRYARFGQIGAYLKYPLRAIPGLTESAPDTIECDGCGPGGGAGGFAVSGQDDVATADRKFNAAGHDFFLDSAKAISISKKSDGEFGVSRLLIEDDVIALQRLSETGVPGGSLEVNGNRVIMSVPKAGGGDNSISVDQDAIRMSLTNAGTAGLKGIYINPITKEVTMGDQAAGSGSVGTLQQVTDAGATTSNAVTFSGNITYAPGGNDVFRLRPPTGGYGNTFVEINGRNAINEIPLVVNNIGVGDAGVYFNSASGGGVSLINFGGTPRLQSFNKGLHFLSVDQAFDGSNETYLFSEENKAPGRKTFVVRGSNATYGAKTGNIFEVQNSGQTSLFSVAPSGTINSSTLAGTGTRMVVADASGNVSTQAIPSGGGGTSYMDRLSVATVSAGSTTITASWASELANYSTIVVKIYNLDISSSQNLVGQVSYDGTTFVGGTGYKWRMWYQSHSAPDEGYFTSTFRIANGIHADAYRNKIEIEIPRPASTGLNAFCTWTADFMGSGNMPQRYSGTAIELAQTGAWRALRLSLENAATFDGATVEVWGIK